jgi:hypothetical protein
MATPLSDALDKLVAHIKPIADEIGVREINKYPKAMIEGINPPVIDLYPIPGEPPKVIGVGGPLIIQHRFHFRLMFYSQVFTAEMKFEDSYLKLDKILDYLLNHLSIDDGWGDMGLSESDSFDGLYINPGEIFGFGGEYEGGYIDIPVTRLENY